MSTNSMKFGTIFNIRSSDYSESIDYKKEMYILRKNSSAPYFPISDRFDIVKTSEILYRGDCYVCNYTHRMQRNFIDSDTPTNDTIVDPRCWIKNFVVHDDGNGTHLNRILNTFKVTGTSDTMPISGSGGNISLPGEDHPPGKSFISNLTSTVTDFFGSSSPQVRGSDKINRGDVNAIPLGH